MIKLSIIVPIYNASSYLHKCLDSLVSQTLSDIEIICINDGSTDDSLKILEEYAQRDNRIKVLTQDNKGIGYSRNLGLSIAQGEYVAFVDADDFVEESTYIVAYEKAKERDCDILMFNFNCIVDDGSELHPDVKKYFNMESYFKSKDIPPKFSYMDLSDKILQVSWNIWNKLYRRDFIIANNIKFINTYFQDSPFHLETLVLADNISFLPEKLYNYRMQNPASVTNTHYKSIRVFDFFKVVDEMKRMLLKHKKFDELKRQYLEFKLVVLNAHLISIQDEKLYKSFYKNIIASLKKEKITIDVLRGLKLALALDHFLYSDEFLRDFNSFSIYNSLLTKLAKHNFRIFNTLS